MSGNQTITDVFVIAEIGVNHNGRLDLALELIDRAADAGADAVKFQTFKADKVSAGNTSTVAYQKDRAGARDQVELLRNLELSADAYAQIVARCNERGIEFFSTAFDAASLEQLLELGLKRIKIPSGEITNTPFLEQAAASGLPIIVSTGMATLEEIGEALDTLRAATPAGPGLNVCVLQCTTAYPTPPEDLNLSAMTTIAETYKVPVGFSDHSVGILFAPAAVAMGATVIEKHITLDRTLPGPDHFASIEPAELVSMVRNIRLMTQALGDGNKVPRQSELEAREKVRRGIKAARELPAGHTLAADDLAILRPTTGLAPRHYHELIGRTLKSDVGMHAPIDWDHLTD